MLDLFGLLGMLGRALCLELAIVLCQSGVCVRSLQPAWCASLAFDVVSIATSTWYDGSKLLCNVDPHEENVRPIRIGAHRLCRGAIKNLAPALQGRKG